MDNKQDIFTRVLELLGTVEEGFIHVKGQIEELKYENALVMMHDIVEGIDEIGKSFKTLEEDLPESSEKLKQGLIGFVTSYEQQKQANLSAQIDTIIAEFTNWKETIEETIRPQTPAS